MKPLVVDAVEVHAEGEPGRVLLDAHRWVEGDTIEERFAFCRENLDWLRLLMLREPRGYPALCSVITMPPTHPEADVAIVVVEQAGFTPMSGSNTMCAVTALLETGALALREPVTTVTVETAVGLVKAEAFVSGGKVEQVRLHNVPAFVVELDRVLDVPGLGEVAVDVVFGGQFFVQADAAALGLRLEPNNAKALVTAGAQIKLAALDQIRVEHPINPDINAVSVVMLYGEAVTAGTDARNTVVLSNGSLTSDPRTWTGALDRSPCGTGTCGRMAARYARGELELGQPFVHESIIGTRFIGRLEDTCTVGEVTAVRPSIAGRAWVTGRAQWTLDPSDPFPHGYTVGDIWAPSP